MKVYIVDVKSDKSYQEYNCVDNLQKALDYSIKNFALQNNLTIDQFGGIPYCDCYLIATTIKPMF